MPTVIPLTVLGTILFCIIGLVVTAALFCYNYNQMIKEYKRAEDSWRRMFSAIEEARKTIETAIAQQDKRTNK